MSNHTCSVFSILRESHCQVAVGGKNVSLNPVNMRMFPEGFQRTSLVVIVSDVTATVLLGLNFIHVGHSMTLKSHPSLLIILLAHLDSSCC